MQTFIARLKGKFTYFINTFSNQHRYPYFIEAWINLDNGSEALFKYEKVLGRLFELVKSWVFSEVLKSGFLLKRVSGSAEMFCVLGGFVKF